MKLSCIRISGIRNIFLTFALLATVAKNRSAAQGLSSPYYYVVVGGFASQKNAENFTAYVLELNYPARYAFNSNRKLYYVYVRLTKDKQKARQLAYRLRSEKQFKNAWIYNGSLEGNTVEESMAASTTDDVEKPVADEETDSVVPVVEQTVVAEQTTTEEPAAEHSPVAEAPTQPAKPIGKSFVFQLINSVDNKPVNGTIRLLESETDDQGTRYDANERVSIPVPQTGKLIMICNLIGYKLVKRAIRYDDPVKSIKGASIGTDQEVIIPIKLVPVDRGDYIELEQVKFYENSAILTPASEPELLELVNLMANPHCKIKLYGHTHRNESGEIITKGDSDNFFAPDPANKHSHGSAKELSKHRADAVKDYLVSKGIDANRISTKGYGTMLAIYENATANERIEVEITKN